MMLGERTGKYRLGDRVHQVMRATSRPARSTSAWWKQSASCSADAAKKRS
jgi:hypothetical protein